MEDLFRGRADISRHSAGMVVGKYVLLGSWQQPFVSCIQWCEEEDRYYLRIEKHYFSD